VALKRDGKVGAGAIDPDQLLLESGARPVWQEGEACRKAAIGQMKTLRVGQRVRLADEVGVVVQSSSGRGGACRVLWDTPAPPDTPIRRYEWTQGLQAALLEAFEQRVGGDYVWLEDSRTWALVEGTGGEAMQTDDGGTSTGPLLSVRSRKRPVAAKRGTISEAESASLRTGIPQGGMPPAIRTVFAEQVAGIFAAAKPSRIAFAMLGVKFWEGEKKWSWETWD